MFERVTRAALPVAVATLATATTFAQAATEGAQDAAASTGQQAADTVMTLLGIALLLWIVGNILTKHNYNTGGPKGEKLPPAQ